MFVKNPNPNHRPVFNELDIANAKPYKTRIVKNSKPYTLPDFSKVEAGRHKPQPADYSLPNYEPIKPIELKPIAADNIIVVVNFFLEKFPGAKISVVDGIIELWDAVAKNPYEAVPCYDSDFDVTVRFNGEIKEFRISPPRPKRSHKKKLAS